MPGKGGPVPDDRDYEPKCFEQTLDEELKQVHKTRRLWRPTTESSSNTTKPRPKQDTEKPYRRKVIERAHQAKLLGLSFSGGGIRSATFNLGVLQALAKLGLLDHVDYLSTVSGGGYIGSWFTAWIRRRDEQLRKEDEQLEQALKKVAEHGQETADKLGEVVYAGETSKATDVRRNAQRCGFNSVVNELKSEVGEGVAGSNCGALRPDPDPIQHLREYSNYLTPQRGLWSADAWTVGITYFRNFLLTFSVLLGSVFALALATGALASGFFSVAYTDPSVSVSLCAAPSLCIILSVNHLVAGGFFFTLFVASLLLGWELALMLDGEQEREDRKRRRPPLNWAVFATFLGASFGALWLWRNPAELKAWQPTALIMVIAMGGGLLGRAVAYRHSFALIRPLIAALADIKHHFRLFVSGFLALVVLLGALYLIGDWMTGWVLADTIDTDPGRWHVVIWGPPLVVFVFWLSATVFVSLASRALDELHRELLARYFAVITKWSVLTTALLLISVYSYPLVLAAGKQGAEVNLTLGTAWAAVSAVGAWLAGSAKDTGRPWVSRLKNIVLTLAPYIFSVGLLIISIWMVHALLDCVLGLARQNNITWHQWLLPDTGDLSGVQGDDRFWDRMTHGYWKLLLLAGVAVFFVTLIWSVRLGVNRFSLHALYGNRLVRAYLGASNLKRNAHPFHGFDDRDNNVRMKDLVADCYSGPLLIVNTAINLVSSRRLAWQKRKAASFTFTPLFAGYEFYGADDTNNDRSSADWSGRFTGGYLPSTIYGGSGRSGGSKGVSLGKVMTISGAAASPNMGYHSSPGLAFLMTTFNVRLGWWLPNTRRKHEQAADQGQNPAESWRSRFDRWLWKEHIKRDGPYFGLIYLIFELLGRTHARSRYVYLSDGGHFENLGIYELVRRRCRFIIACDAEADPHMNFDGLGNAIEKCRTDLGVPIEIDVSQLRSDPTTGLSRWHCAVGCIRYSEADSGAADGTILYIKASRTGGEPQDVQTYAEEHSTFPHEATADQWFDETQFESYRALGKYCAEQVLGMAAQVATKAGLEGRQSIHRTFLELRKQWYPRAAGADSKPADHDALLEAMLDTIREDKRLAFLDAQLYPNLHRVAVSEKSGKFARADQKPWLPRDYNDLRAGFYFCKRLIQFMQQVYHDCRLDTEYAAPSRRGWMNLFRRWSWSRMFRFTWVMTAGTYSARFQSFCEHHLALETGEPHFEEEPLRVRARYADAGKQPVVEVLDEKTGRAIGWEAAETDSGIDLDERRLVTEFIEAYVMCPKLREGAKLSSLCEEFKERKILDFEVYTLKVETESPLTDEEIPIRLNAGFLIVGPHAQVQDGKVMRKKAILYVRVRSSMRNMDLARKAFLNCNQHRKPSTYEFEIVKDLPVVAEALKAPWQKRAYREIHMMERENLDRCRWFSQLLDDLGGEEESETEEEVPPCCRTLE